MAFIQDPRLRQRWNQLSHNAEAVTSDAAAGIWAFGHRYVNPCLAGLADAVDACTSVCLGDREERARRARERDRGARRTRARAEYSFDFYDDWEEDLLEDEFADYDYDYDDDGDERAGAGGVGASGRGGGGGLLGGWRGRSEDWERLLAGTGHRHHHQRHRGSVVGGGVGDVVDQPRRKRGMSYGTRAGPGRRKVSGEEDPNVIPRTAPLGFLGRLPFKIVGSLRYKPSAANLKVHPGGGMAQGYRADGGVGAEERDPLLGTSDEEDSRRHRRRSPPRQSRPRSSTTESGDTSSSYRSRGDLFPSDGEGEEDAVPLGDEFTVALERVDDRSSNKTRSSKGKRRADRDRDKGLSRTVSRSTVSSAYTPEEAKSGSSLAASPYKGPEDVVAVPSLEDLQREEEQAEREEHEEIERRRKAAQQLARQRGLSRGVADTPETLPETKGERPDRGPQGPAAEEPMPGIDGTAVEEVAETKPPPPTPPEPAMTQANDKERGLREEGQFVPARLPHFG
ncbi:hypothetical protein VTK56DRAFT_7099 [Thermocarpiscus australiensis]